MPQHHILILCDSLPGARTSTAAMIGSLQNELLARGHTVDLAGMGSEDVVKDFPWAIHAPRLKADGMARRALVEAGTSLRLGMRLAWAIQSGRLRRPDLIVLFTPSLFLALAAAAVKAAASCKLYMVQRDIVPDWLVTSGRVKPGLAVSVLRALKHFSLRRADRVGIECEQNVLFFPARFHPKLEVLHNWRDFERDVYFEPPPQGAPTLVYGGRVGQVQGFDRFLRAFLASPDTSARLTIYCDPRGRGEIEAMGLKDEELHNIELRPMLDEEAFLARAAAASWGVVTLSPQMQTHNIPGKTLAYLAAGIPILAFGPRDAALRSVISRLGIGHYFDAGDEAGSRDQLRRVLTDPLAQPRARESVLAARSAFSPASAADMVLSIPD